jgi:membrane glycosyltransferase
MKNNLAEIIGENETQAEFLLCFKEKTLSVEEQFCEDAFYPKPGTSFFQRVFVRPGIFFAGVFLLTVFQIHLFIHSVLFEQGSLFPYLWTGAFAALSVNISILACQMIFALWIKSPHFSKSSKTRARSMPVAVLYCVKNESFGLFERITYTLEGNLLPRLHLWVLSDSDEVFGRDEAFLIERLSDRFGKEKIHYRRRQDPYERKQGNIKDWLDLFGRDYDYFIVCDADSLLPRGWAEEMIRIAEHTNHFDIGVFQSAIYVTHEKSFYARMQAIGQFYAQRLYFHVNQAVFGRSIAFGHNCLVRRSAFEKIALPRGILSHDNWESALLDRAGWRTVFLRDIVSFEETTPHYLEERRRSKRWLKGTLQGWPLLFIPGISFSTRFLIFYQIYLHLVPALLCFWMVSALCAAFSLNNDLFVADGNSYVLFCLTCIVLYFHKFTVAQNATDIRRIVKETIFTTVVGLQNVFYGTIDLLSLPFEKLSWKPMAKNPSEQPTLRECVKHLFFGTTVGFAGCLVGFNYAPVWALFALPVLTSLIFSIPSVFLSSRLMRESV